MSELGVASLTDTAVNTNIINVAHQPVQQHSGIKKHRKFCIFSSANALVSQKMYV